MVKGEQAECSGRSELPPLACTVSPANVQDSLPYEPILEAFEIHDVPDRPSFISADAAYDAREIRQ